MADNDYANASPEFREYWEKNQVDPDVARRVNELRAEGRLKEMADVIRTYILSREDWIQGIREDWEALKRGEIKFKTPPHDPSG